MRENKSRGENPSTKFKIDFNTLSCGMVELELLSAAKSTRSGAWAQMTLTPATKFKFLKENIIEQKGKEKWNIPQSRKRGKKKCAQHRDGDGYPHDAGTG